MKDYKFRMLVWEVNAVLDTGKFDDIPTEEIHRQAEAGTISSYIVDRFGDDMDLSVIEPQDWTDLNEEWQSFHNAIDETRKMGIVNRGVCLLLGYALQSYLQRERERK